MKKFFLLMALLIVSATTTYAQFEKGKWYVNGSYMGLGIGNGKLHNYNHGLSFEVGNFIENNFSLNLNYRTTHYEQSIGTQARYYLFNSGVFGGLGFSYKSLKNVDSKKKHHVYLTPEVGYAFFINKVITFEPALYYDYSLVKPGDYNRLGLKLGFGFYL